MLLLPVLHLPLSLCMVIFGLKSNALTCYCIRSGFDHVDYDVIIVIRVSKSD